MDSKDDENKSIFKSDNTLGKSTFLIDHGKTGIVNRGNTCYINACIQILSNTTVFTEYLLTGKFKKDIDYNKRKKHKSCKILTELIALLKGMWEDNCVVNPVSFSRTFLKNYNFVEFNQEDACEAIQVLIDALHEALAYSVSIKPEGVSKNASDEMEKKSIEAWSSMFEKKYSFMVETFFGQFHSKIESIDGTYESHSYEPFAIITAPIADECKTLYDCLDNEFLSNEKLDGDNQIRLDDGTKVDGMKSHGIWRAGQVLLIALKRFKYTMINGTLIKRKENKLIDFPITGLDISKYIDGYSDDNNKYNLYAICNHSGSGTDFGHYYAVCKNNNSKWYCYNDRFVFETTNLITPDAYILCYKKVSEDDINSLNSDVITIDTSNSSNKSNLLSSNNQDEDDDDDDDEDDNEDQSDDETHNNSHVGNIIFNSSASA
jgi:ubiquitin C-terminal hydrolase